MKFILIIFLSTFFLTSVSLAEESKNDTVVNCHPVKVTDEYRSFHLRLRNTEEGVKIVKNSLDVSSPQTFEAKKYFSIVALNPKLDVKNESIEILSGSHDTETYSAFGIYKQKNTPLWTGRLQLWWPNQTSSYTTKMLCTVSPENYNSEPVIP